MTQRSISPTPTRFVPDTLHIVAREWVRPYRAGLVWHVVWWFDVVLAVPMAAAGIVLLVAGIGTLEPVLALFGAFMAPFSVMVGVGAWRLIHLGVWTGTSGVEIRTLFHPVQRFPWSAVDRFEVAPGRSVLPFAHPAPQVAVILRDLPPVLVPGLWRRSPFTWGGVGPHGIVQYLNQRCPDLHRIEPR